MKKLFTKVKAFFSGLFKKKKKRDVVVTGNAKIDEKTTFGERFKAKYLNTYFLKKVLWILFRLVLLVGVSYVILYPYFSKLTSSFMAREDFVDTTVKLVPRNWTLDTYKAIINDNKYFISLFNTTVLSVLCGVSQMLVCAIIGYGFAKFKFKFKNILFMCVIFTMIIPHETLKLAMFIRFRYFDIWGLYGLFYNTIGEGLLGLKEQASPAIANLLNTYWPLALLSLTGLAFKNGLYIYMMRQYYRGVPDELEEAAYVDGAGVIKTFVRIILPMSVPLLVTIFMFAFSWQWTDTFYTGVFFTDTTKNQLLANIVAIPASLDTDFAGQTAFETAIRNTCGILILMPLLVIYMFAQRTLIEGVERSGITG